MDSIKSAKKRKAACDSHVPLARLSLAELNGLIDRRVDEKILALTSRVDVLQRVNEGLLHRCESLERSIQVLKKESNWTYSAVDVPSSHWIEQGHDDEFLVQSIKDCTEDLRLHSNEEVIVNGNDNPSDDAVDPHWDQLANVIQLSERIKVLDLENAQLNVCSLQKIEASLRQKSIVEFNLVANHFRGAKACNLPPMCSRATKRSQSSAGVTTHFTVQRKPVTSLILSWNIKQSVV